jgi:hypothetical protein
LLLALALSLSAAISLGITRFPYSLLLLPMREDLGWSYTLAGAMNTANAVGYLIGALAMSRLVRRSAPTRVLLWGSVLATLFMAASGFFTASAPLLVQRLLAGVVSALVSALAACWRRISRHNSRIAVAFCSACTTAVLAWALCCRRWACRCCWPGRRGCWRRRKRWRVEEWLWSQGAVPNGHLTPWQPAFFGFATSVSRWLVMRALALATSAT